MLNLDLKAKKYEDLGFSTFCSKTTVEQEAEGRIDIINKRDQIKYIQKYLGVRDEKPLYYEMHIIKKFYAALHTNQIIVLSGEPGTGKTSLVEGFAEAISAEYRIIPVQPNWTDNQDLLGFYNPIEKTYVSTSFLDAIIDAKDCPEKLFIICLDEMNLAHVEYYFSEFLSKLQSSDKTLDLYSSYIYEHIGVEIHGKIMRYVDKDVGLDIKDIDKIDLILSTFTEEENEDHFKLIWQWNMFKRYKSEITIPGNIRFVGTINKDETTKNLSPKVIDRSFVIELDRLRDEIKEDLLKNKKDYKKEYGERLFLNANNFPINESELVDELSSKIIKIRGLLRKLDVHLNNRFDVQVKQIIASDIFNDSDEVFDFIASCMILPKININIETQDDREVDNLEKQLSNTEVSGKILSGMKEYADQAHVLTFWR